MKVEGDEAKDYDAVSLSSFARVNGRGTLKFADDQTGVVRWDDRGEEKTVDLGAHAVRILLRDSRGD